jgi:hypothetical protein
VVIVNHTHTHETCKENYLRKPVGYTINRLPVWHVDSVVSEHAAASRHEIVAGSVRP